MDWRRYGKLLQIFYTIWNIQNKYMVGFENTNIKKHIRSHQHVRSTPVPTHLFGGGVLHAL